MHTQVEIEGKSVDVEISKEANCILANRNVPLTAEMELYFSCLLRKKVKFYEQKEDQNVISVLIGDHLKIRFRPVMTRVCKLDDDYNEEDYLQDFPIVNSRPYVPKWLKIDFRFGRWFGEFGYA